MYYFKYGNSTMEVALPAVFSATILDFALKGIIEFEPIDKNDFYLIIKNCKPFYNLILMGSLLLCFLKLFEKRILK